MSREGKYPISGEENLAVCCHSGLFSDGLIRIIYLEHGALLIDHLLYVDN